MPAQSVQETRKWPCALQGWKQPGEAAGVLKEEAPRWRASEQIPQAGDEGKLLSASGTCSPVRVTTGFRGRRDFREHGGTALPRAGWEATTEDTGGTSGCWVPTLGLMLCCHCLVILHYFLPQVATFQLCTRLPISCPAAHLDHRGR